MWVFGHLGIGSKIVQPLRKDLSYGWVLFGALLPDLIDKPLYYGAAWSTGRWGDEIGLISCTRTFGHSGIFIALLLAAAYFRRSRVLAALVLGVASHFALDGIQDYYALHNHLIERPSSMEMALLFPWFHRFASMPYASARDHLATVGQPFLLATEAVGALIIAWDYWKYRELRFPTWVRAIPRRIRMWDRYR